MENKTIAQKGKPDKPVSTTAPAPIAPSTTSMTIRTRQRAERFFWPSVGARGVGMRLRCLLTCSTIYDRDWGNAGPIKTARTVLACQLCRHPHELGQALAFSRSAITR